MQCWQTWCNPCISSFPPRDGTACTENMSFYLLQLMASLMFYWAFLYACLTMLTSLFVGAEMETNGWTIKIRLIRADSVASSKTSEMRVLGQKDACPLSPLSYGQILHWDTCIAFKGCLKMTSGADIWSNLSRCSWVGCCLWTCPLSIHASMRSY